MTKIYDTFKTVMTKQEKLDGIETDLKEIKRSLEYAHAEIKDLRKENEIITAVQTKASERIQYLERNSNMLRDNVRFTQCSTWVCNHSLPTVLDLG